MSEPLYTEYEVLNGLEAQKVAKFILSHAAIIAESERLIKLGNEVLLGYDTTIDLELEKMNETNTDIAGT